ncbi:MAG: hypothetical protein ABI433_04515 [Burkholderiaceae bacterium]
MLKADVLRILTIDPLQHPRGQSHLSAASGLVCTHGRVYVISDDEHHLVVFRDRASQGAMHRLFTGDLPAGKKARKRLKPDLETLLCLPPFGGSPNAALLALGSGSRANRSTGVVIPLGDGGEPSADIRSFDLESLYTPLREALGEINIEGAMLVGDEFVLLNRGVAGRTDNAAARYPLPALIDALEGSVSAVKPASIRRFMLGHIEGVPLAFTDAAALPGGGWVFTAVAEDTRDSYADGHCRGSVVGVVDARGALVATHRLDRLVKVEGIAVHVDGAGMTLCMVTDADDPAQGSQLLLARL